MMLTSILDSNFKDIINGCKSAICNFSIKDFIEIVILAGLLFLAFHLLKGRKAGALVTGLLVVAGLAALSRILNFNVLYKLFSTILGSGLLVVIIIFQPEIRDVLEKIGNGSLKGIMSIGDRKKNKEKHFDAIERVCTAVAELSRDSTGALIVIERSISILDSVNVGAHINANVNDLLIRNLFFNKSPLHDGAIVISGDKILAAGCFLPLTQRPDIDSDLGTRHRAAMGMAEKSDAIVVVVSEETGRISVAHDFKIIRNLSPGELKAYLHEHVLRIGGNFSDK
jgi:diadenylate cyclase